MEFEFSVNDPLEDNAHYKIQDKDLGSGPEARPLGRGNAGITYRAKYKGMDRAVKFLVPDVKGDAQSELPLEVLTRAFTREIALLSRLTHTHLVKIVDFGEIRRAEASAKNPYYVMEFVDGEPLNRYCRSHSVRDVLDVLDGLLDALALLHSHDYYHMDVKEENILVQVPPGSQPRAVLLDLGGAKQISQGSPTAGDQDKTIYVSSEKATRRERIKLLGKAVSRTQLSKWGVDLDLYAVGAILRRALDDQNGQLRVKAQRELGGSGLVALEWVTDRLTEGASDDAMATRYYKSARQLRSDLRRLAPEYVYPLGLPELNLVVGPTSIQLSSERVGLTEDMAQIVNHVLFQRLRNVSQLEYVHLIYPSARQSRFDHVLSTFHLSRLFLCRLLDFPEFRMMATPEYIQATLLVALLHDIGHYPLSHMFEDFAVEAKDIAHIPEGCVPSDEALFRSFVCPHKADRFNAIINRTLVPLMGQAAPIGLDILLGQLFPRSYELIPKVMYTDRGAAPPVPLLHSLIDSAIDIDKLAYLTNDSSATGVAFGRGIDVPGLVSALVPPRDQDHKKGAVAITEDGLAAAEATVLARFWMISRVYWHRTNRAVMAMHKFVIADLMKAGRLSFERYFEDTLYATQESATELLASLYDAAYAHGGNQADIPIRNPLAGLVGARRDLYKRLLTISNGPSESDSRLYEKITDAGAYGVLEIGERIRKNLIEQFRVKLHHGDVLVDVPQKRREYLGSNVLVYLDRDPRTGKDLVGEHGVSAVLRGLPKSYEHNVKKCRVFVHPTVLELFRGVAELERVRDAVRRYLEDHYDIHPNLAR